MGNSSTTISSRTAARSPPAASSRALTAGLSGVLEKTPPSQYDWPSISVIGKLGGRLPLAATCSNVRPPGRRLSKNSISPVPTLVAPTKTPVASSLSLSGSTSSASVSRRGPVSYTLVNAHGAVSQSLCSPDKPGVSREGGGRPAGLG